MILPREDWPRLKEAFEGARTLAVDARAAYLAAACDGDERLRQEVETLLASHDQARSFLETPALLSGDTMLTKSLEGQCIGSYQFAERIGTGGMGEVYRARDTKLNRQVAIKVLLPAVADDPDRLARFSREAQVLASLNHPHIAQIHGFDDAGGPRALVMELVEGPTLADRIACGAIPIDEALPIAKQIAEALEAAHAQGVVHRDLKPANIKIRADGTVKVLDFGLAKALDASSGAGVDATSSPATGVRATEVGVILGTAAYMSPEQARGKPVDKRTDMWAFGCVLYEMLTARSPFAGDTISDTIAAILEHEPDRTLLPADMPAPIRTLLRRCLEKDRNRRLDSASAARLEIDDVLMAQPGEVGAAAASSRRGAPVAVVALGGGALLAALAMWTVVRPGPQAPELPSSRFAIVSPPGQPVNVSGFARDIALSPDGRHLVYRVGGSNTAGSPLVVRAIDQLDARPLADITHAYAPFFSPDSQWIGFFENAELKKVSIRGGPAVTIGPVTGGPLGASWSDDSTIVFATDDPDTGLWRVSADGGQPALLTRPDTAEREGDHGSPSVLPGGRSVLFTIAAGGRTDNPQVAVVDLTSGQRKTLISGSQADYVDISRGSGQAPSAVSRQAGHLIYEGAGTLRAVRFDPVRLEVFGDPVTVAEHVMKKPTVAANYAVSRTGTLVYMVAGAGGQTTPHSLVWVDRKGHEEPIRAPLRAYGTPRLSPDGTRVAAEIYDQNTDIWIWDFARETLRRLTFDPGGDGMSVWTPDGRRIIFESSRPGVPNVYAQAADGTGTVDRLTTSSTAQWPTAITPDGTWLAGFDLLPRTTTSDIVFFPLTRPVRRSGSAPAPGVSSSSMEPLAQTRFKGGFADFSPNGRYLAYWSRESGRNEIYVRPFPRVDSGRWQVSTAGGTRPVWARSGRELFYLDESNSLTSVPVSTSGPTFSAGTPATVFETKYVQSNPSRHYDVSADGQRFLMIKASATADPNATPASMVVVLNWFEELKQRVPTNGK